MEESSSAGAGHEMAGSRHYLNKFLHDPGPQPAGLVRSVSSVSSINNMLHGGELCSSAPLSALCSWLTHGSTCHLHSVHSLVSGACLCRHRCLRPPRLPLCPHHHMKTRPAASYTEAESFTDILASFDAATAGAPGTTARPRPVPSFSNSDL